MNTFIQKTKWIFATIVGSVIFAAGFAFFLMPNDMSPGGISGLSLVIVELLNFGSVGTLSIAINTPLFIMGGVKIGRKFFFGSLLGMLLSNALIDLFATFGLPAVEPLIGVLYGGVICGVGLGLVFVNGVCAQKNDMRLNDGDVISLRGKGKATLEVGGTSKKDRIFITLNSWS